MDVSEENYFTMVIVNDWKNMPEDQKADLIDGHIYLQAAAKKEHSSIQGQLRGIIHPLQAKMENENFELNKWHFATEVGVIYQQNALTHYLAGWKTDRLKAFNSEPYFDLSPDWVCEITSTNWRMDTIFKRDILQTNLVPYYWIIGPTEKTLTILVLDNNNNYVTYCNLQKNDSFNFPLVPFENITIDLSMIFNY